MEKPEFRNICNNLNYVKIGSVGLWFSYNTLVAFSVNGNLIIRENIWSNTTGKHLNMIDGGNNLRRYNSNEFKELWDKEVGSLFVNSLFN